MLLIFASFCYKLSLAHSSETAMGEKEKSIGSSIILNQQNWLKIVLNYSVLLRVWIIANEKNIYYVFLSHALLLI